MLNLQAIVIGAGQAGLSVGYHLAKRGVRFVILEAYPRVGDAWRHRWDSLRLVPPARFNGLPGMRFPAHGDAFPTKDQMADYLEEYALRFALPVCRHVSVDRVSREGDLYAVTAKKARFEAPHVVVAMANYQWPSVPRYARLLDPGVVQLHSYHYRNPSQLKNGSVLVVGAGNSGAEIALELARAGHRVWLSGRDTGRVPTLMPWSLLLFMWHHMLTTDTPLGRRSRFSASSGGASLVRVRPRDLAAAGVERVPRVADVQCGAPVLADGHRLDAANVVWCTGFERGFPWIDLPISGDDGEPLHRRGIVTTEPGLYFVGLRFLYALSSSTIHGIDRDASHVAEIIARRVGAVRVPAGSPALASAWW
jgi:putative flavoprotein involved in K+ transport